MRWCAEDIGWALRWRSHVVVHSSAAAMEAYLPVGAVGG